MFLLPNFCIFWTKLKRAEHHGAPDVLTCKAEWEHSFSTFRRGHGICSMIPISRRNHWAHIYIPKFCSKGEKCPMRSEFLIQGWIFATSPVETILWFAFFWPLNLACEVVDCFWPELPQGNDPWQNVFHIVVIDSGQSGVFCLCLAIGPRTLHCYTMGGLKSDRHCCRLCHFVHEPELVLWLLVYHWWRTDEKVVSL